MVSVACRRRPVSTGRKGWRCRCHKWLPAVYSFPAAGLPARRPRPRPPAPPLQNSPRPSLGMVSPRLLAQQLCALHASSSAVSVYEAEAGPHLGRSAQLTCRKPSILRLIAEGKASGTKRKGGRQGRASAEKAAKRRRMVGGILKTVGTAAPGQQCTQCSTQVCLPCMSHVCGLYPGDLYPLRT